MCSPFETLTHTHEQIPSLVVNLSYIDFFHIEGFESNCKLFSWFFMTSQFGGT